MNCKKGVNQWVNSELVLIQISVMFYLKKQTLPLVDSTDWSGAVILVNVFWSRYFMSYFVFYCLAVADQLPTLGK